MTDRLRAPLATGALGALVLASALTLAAPASATTSEPTGSEPTSSESTGSASTSSEPTGSASTSSEPTTSVAVTTTTTASEDCLSLDAGRFKHTFDADALTLTVEFVPDDADATGATICDGGQAFAVATWALEQPSTANVPQRLIGAVGATVTVAGPDGQQVITAAPAGSCSVQVDGYMAAAADVPEVLTGFSGKPDANEPPLVNQKRAPYPSDGNPAYTVVGGDVCTAPPVVVPAAVCVEGAPVVGVEVTNPNPWAVEYLATTAAGEPLPDAAGEPFEVAPGDTATLALAGLTEGITLTVTDSNGVSVDVDLDVPECTTEAGTTSTTPTPTAETSTPEAAETTTTTVAPVIEPVTVVPTATAAPTTSPEKPEVDDVAPLTTVTTAQQPLAYTGSPVSTVLFSGLGLLVLGAGLTVVSRRRKH